MTPEPRIDVCDKCFRRSCWDGIAMCDEARNAGLVKKTVAQLRQLAVEHPDYYEPYFDHLEEMRKT